MSKERELLERLAKADVADYYDLLVEIQEFLAQPEQEPVAWITEWVQRYRYDSTPIINRAVSFIKGDVPAAPNPSYIPLYIRT